MMVMIKNDNCDECENENKSRSACWWLLVKTPTTAAKSRNHAISNLKIEHNGTQIFMMVMIKMIIVMNVKMKTKADPLTGGCW